MNGLGRSASSEVFSRDFDRTTATTVRREVPVCETFCVIEKMTEDLIQRLRRISGTILCTPETGSKELSGPSGGPSDLVTTAIRIEGRIGEAIRVAGEIESRLT